MHKNNSTLMSSATTLGMIAPISNFKECESSTEDDEDAFKRKKIEHHPDEKVEFDGINDIACDDNNGDYDDDDYDDYYDDHDDPIGGISVSSGSKKMNFSHSVANTVNKMQAIEAKKRILHTSRDDRATTEQCLDPRTRMMLFKMLSNGILDTIDGCLSTGKEANVYYAKGGKKAAGLVASSSKTSGTGENVDFSSHIKATDRCIDEFAIKIYKTSILVFKDRDKYVSGEHRWRRGYCKSNPRKMVKVWAEKELRNYRRIHAAGIPCPTPIFLRSHILLMEFLGKNGWPSPRLKDATLSERHMREAVSGTYRVHFFVSCSMLIVIAPFLLLR